MELLRISDKKLKVSLSDSDMEKYRLDCESLDYDTTETRSAFWQILDEAKHQIGFDACGGKLFVQVYPSRGGGCEMYITLVAGETDEDHPRSEWRESVYRFSSLALLQAVLRQLQAVGYHEKSSLYFLCGAYYLFIFERAEGNLISPRSLGEYGFIEEYGTRLFGGLRHLYVREHGACLADRAAVEKFSDL